MKLNGRIVVLFVTVILIVAAIRLVAAQQPAAVGGETPKVVQFSGSTLEGDTPIAPSKTESMIKTLQDSITADPSNQEAYTQLALGYLQRARETGDSTFYNLADQAINKSLELNPNDIAALVAKGSLMLSRHEFSEAEALGQKVLAINDHSAAVFGFLSDAQIELGKYDEAVDTIQRMVDLRPDLSSYARVSYARELHGDTEGAIISMKQAITAGANSSENTNWCRVQLGNIYFMSGDLANAEASYQTALDAVPGYLHALAGLGNVAQARGDLAKSVEYYTQATKIVPVPQYVAALGDVYSKMGDTANAKKQYDLFDFISQTYKVNGVLFGIEGAMFYADHDSQLDQALAQAQAEAVTRNDVHTHDSLAWVLYKMGRFDEAWQHAQQATRLNTKEPLILFHAGMIAKAAGQTDKARSLLQEAITLNPKFHVLYGDVAAETLKSLQ